MEEEKQIHLEQNVMGISSEFMSFFSDLETYEVVPRFTPCCIWVQELVWQQIRRLGFSTS